MLWADGALLCMGLWTGLGAGLKERRCARLRLLENEMELLTRMRLLILEERLGLPALLRTCASDGGEGVFSHRLEKAAEILEKHFQWPDVEAHFNEVIDVLEPILPRHIARWKNMKLSNWQKNISATEYYARVRPKKIPEMLQKAMKLTDEEVETYFGEVLRLLEETNTKK